MKEIIIKDKRYKYMHEGFSGGREFDGCSFFLIDFLRITDSVGDLKFNNCSFYDCTIDETFFRKSTFLECDFVDCRFVGTPVDAAFEDCTFADTSIPHSGIYRIIICSRKLIRIGCEHRTLDEWKHFFSDRCTEEIYTPRDSPKFEEIKQDFHNALKILNHIL